MLAKENEFNLWLEKKRLMRFLFDIIFSNNEKNLKKKCKDILLSDAKKRMSLSAGQH